MIEFEKVSDTTSFAYYGEAESLDEALSNLLDIPHKYIAVDVETIALKGTKKITHKSDGLEGFEVNPQWSPEEFLQAISEAKEKGTSWDEYLDARTPIGVGVAVSPSEAYYFPLRAVKGQDSPTQHLWALQQVLASGIPQVYFNGAFDLKVFKDFLGIDVGSITWEDVSIACQVQGLPHSLDQAVGHLLVRDHRTIQEVLAALGKKGATMLDVEFTNTADKCMRDCMDSLELFHLMRMGEWNGEWLAWEDKVGRRYDVTPEIQDCYRVDKALIPILRKMSDRGVALRQDRVEKWYQELSRDRLVLADICRREGFEPGSGQQVGYVLASRGNWLPRTPGGKQLVTDDEWLSKLNDPLAHVVLNYRRKDKLLGTYIAHWRGHERGYGYFRLDLATGRLASFEYNWQNIPPGLRECLAPDNSTGEWYWWDLSQLEMRLFAHMSGDPVMQQEFRDGVDIHTEVCRMLWPEADPKGPQRTKAKNADFAMIFGVGEQRLHEETGIALAEIPEIRDLWLDKYQVGHHTMDAKVYQGFDRSPFPWVETIRGRRMMLSLDQGWHHAYNCGRNWPIQGSGADLIKRAMLERDRQGVDFPIQVHDELLEDGDFGEPEFVKELFELYTPYERKRGEVWS